MDAATQGRFELPRAEQIGLLARSVVWSAIASLLTIALVLLTRRGAVDHALLPPLCTVAMLSSNMIAWSLRRLLTASRGSSAEVMTADIGLGLSLVVLAASLTLPGSHPVDISSMWAILVASEGLAWLRQLPWGEGRAFPFSPRRPRRAVFQARREDKKTEAPAPTAIDRITRFDELPLPVEVEQQLQRTVDAQGNVVITGRLQQKFVPHQRTAAMHVAFCPPLAAVPEVKVEQIDGSESTVKIAEVLPLGVRVEVRLRRASKEPQHVALTLHAHGPQLATE